ncbi:MAG: DUF6792 domain-containing protein [Schleiferilactobacillus perolens]|uniref:DUF6792 domain-containing protein n=1 Tax=Schleiferilactobacillus perolens TaxID=100468 RepID=UPI0039E798FB
MSTAALMAASIQMDQLALRYERAFFDLHTCVPLADNPVQADRMWQSIDQTREKLTALEKEKEQLLTDLTNYFQQPPTDFSAAQHAVLATAVQNALPASSLPRQMIELVGARLNWRNGDSAPLDVINQLAKGIGLSLPTQLRALAALLGSSTLAADPAYFQARSQPFESGGLIHQRSFLFAAIDAQYKKANYNQLTPEAFWQWLLWATSGIYGIPVKVYSARALIPEAAATGLSADAVVLFPPQAAPEAYFLFKGTENVQHDDEPVHLATALAHPLAAMDSNFVEAYRDWRYNVQAVLLGEDSSDSQIDMAQRFITQVAAQLPDETRRFGIGHSLGGHLVQSLQLIYHSFTAGYTLNPAPVQLRQVQQIAPDRFTPAEWDQLFTATSRGIANATDEPLLARTLQDPALAMTNEGFAQDFTRLFYRLRFNVYVGTYYAVRRPQYQYPFITHIDDYLSPAEIQFAANTLGNFFKKTASDQDNQSLSWQIVNYMREWSETTHLPASKRLKYRRDYIRYLEATGWLSTEPQMSRRALPSWLTSRLSDSRLQMFRRIRFDMLELAVFFHIIDGIKFFFLDE